MTFSKANYLTGIGITSLLAALSISSPLAIADETICDGVITTDTSDNVFVPPGASCTLMNVEVDGNFEAVEADEINILGGNIDGNVSIESSTGNIIIDGTDIDGNLSVAYSTSNFINIRSSHVDGNVSVRKNIASSFNSGPPSLYFVVNNTIDGNVEMRKNEADVMLLGSCGQRPDGVEFSNVVDGNVTSAGNLGLFVVLVNCSRLHGNLSVKNNTVLGTSDEDDDEDVQVDFNTISGNVNVVGNTARDQVQLTGNTIAGNLSCKDNDPDPRTDNMPSDPEIPAGAPVEDGNTVDGKVNCSD